MIRLVASDIDGTLLPYGDRDIPEEVFAQIRRLEGKGILFCPASGRQYTSMRRLFAPVADKVPFLCENGAVVYGPGSPGPVLGKTAMDRAQAEELCRQIIALEGVEVLISGEDTSYLCPKEGEIVSVMEGKGNNIVLLSRPEDVPEDIVKIAAYCPGRLEETRSLLAPRWEDRFQVAVAGAEWVDFTLADKGTGLFRLCAALGIGLDEVMAFGDNYNDASMLSVVGRPWVMEGADGPLKERFPNHCRRVADVLRTL